MTTQVRPLVWAAIAVAVVEGTLLLAGAVATAQDLGRGRFDDYVYFGLAGVAGLLLVGGAVLLGLGHRAATASVLAGGVAVGLMLAFFAATSDGNPVGIRILTVLLVGGLQAGVVVLAYRAFAVR